MTLTNIIFLSIILKNKEFLKGSNNFKNVPVTLYLFYVNLRKIASINLILTFRSTPVHNSE